METVYTVEEVATMLKVSIYTVQSWIRYKKINYVKINGVIRIKQSELDRLVG